MEFNRIIKLLRKERGITQKQAAEDLGVSQALLSHYEKGIRECGLDFVVKVADYYNVSCDYLPVSYTHLTIISGLLGLLLACIGLDPLLGVPRLTFGTRFLTSGIEMIPEMCIRDSMRSLP